MVEVNYCREGRFECSFGPNSNCFMAPGDLSASSMMKRKTSASYPMGYYRGITVLVSFPSLAHDFCKLCSSLGIDLDYLRAYISSGNRCVIIRNAEVKGLFERLYQAEAGGDIGRMRLCVLLLLSLLSAPGGADVVESGYHNTEQVRRVRETARFMTEHMNEHHTVGELADMAGMSVSSLKTAFRRIFGTSVYSYLRTYRLQTAQCLLRETDLPVAAIALKVGYGNPGKFSTIFRTVFGITPTEFRSSVRKGKS